MNMLLLVTLIHISKDVSSELISIDLYNTVRLFTTLYMVYTWIYSSWFPKNNW